MAKVLLTLRKSYRLFHEPVSLHKNTRPGLVIPTWFMDAATNLMNQWILVNCQMLVRLWKRYKVCGHDREDGPR